MKCALILAVTALLVLSLRAQVTLHVPSQFPTIRDAYVAAKGGETVVVAPGLYVEDIEISSKTLTLLASGGPQVTTLMGTGITNPPRPVVEMINGCRLIGFTITGGTGKVIPFSYGTDTIAGGGVLVRASTSPLLTEIRDCIITNNRCDRTSNPQAHMRGGGVWISSTNFAIKNCEISHNNMQSLPLNPNSHFGGGIFAHGSGVIEGCTIRGNDIHNGDGGGMSLMTAYVEVRNCLIENNSALRGGGIYYNDFHGTAEHTVFRANTANFDGGAIAFSRPVTLDNCLICDNTAGNLGGAAFCSTPGITLTLNSCTVTNNAAQYGGAVVFSPSAPGHLQLEHSNVWGNGLNQLLVTSTTVGGTWNNVEGVVVPGIGNIDADPLFFAPQVGDYRLTANSPCRDAGDPDVATSSGETDLDGDPRIFNGTRDIGADEFYGVGDSGASRVAAPFATTTDVLRINGSSGGPDRRVVVEGGGVFSLVVDQPPFNIVPAPFLICGYVGVPATIHELVLPYGLGPICFRWPFIGPGTPGSFLLTTNFGPYPGQLTTSHPAPWVLNGVAPAIDFALTFQGLIDHMPAIPVVTNAITLEIRL